MNTSIKSIVVPMIVTGFILCAAGPLAAVEPDVLSQMPANAALVAATGPLNTVGAKFCAFAGQIGLPVGPQMDPAAMLSMQMGIPGMIDPTGRIGLAIGDLTDPENTLTAFLPISDPQAVQSALQAQGAVPIDGSPDMWSCPAINSSYQIVGNYLMIAQNNQALQHCHQQSKGVKLSAADAAFFANSDVAVSADLVPLMGLLRTEIESGLAKAQNMPQAAALKSPAATSVTTMALDRLAEMKTGLAGFRLTDNGISIKSTFRATPGSKLAAFMSDHPTTTISELAALPRDNAAYAIAYKMDESKFIAPTNAILDALMTDPNLADKVDQEDITKIKKLMGQVLASTVSGAMAAYAAPAQPAAGAQAGSAPQPTTAIKFMGFENYTDAAKMVELSKEFLPLISKIAKGFGYDLPMAYKEKVGQVAGKAYDVYEMDMSQLPIPPEAMQALMTAYGGQAKMSFPITQLDKNRLAYASEPGHLGELISFIDSGAPGLASNTEFLQATADLPRRANFFEIVDLGKYMQLAQAQMQAQMQADPMAMMFMGMASMMRGTVAGAATMADGSCTVDVAVPTQLIQSVVMMGMSMMGGPGMMPPGAAGPAGQPSGPPPAF